MEVDEGDETVHDEDAEDEVYNAYYLQLGLDEDIPLLVHVPSLVST